MRKALQNAIVIGSHINALTIVNNLKKIGFNGRIIIACDRLDKKGIVSFIFPEIEVWRGPIKAKGDMVAAIRERFGTNQTPITVFFTDERFLPEFSEVKAEDRSWLKFFIGNPQHVDTILDRQKFCVFLDRIHNGLAPRTIAGDRDPLEFFGEEFVVRPRYSWHGVNQRERVTIVRTQAAFEAAFNGYLNRGLSKSDLCFQELLSTKDEDNVSICGWFDPLHTALICTHKLLQHPPHTGNGDVVERIKAPAGVMETALQVLKGLEFHGPFELEFVYDVAQKRYKIIEMNPRFWMQHGLVEAITGCELTSRYLGKEPLPHSARAPEKTLWVNLMYAVFRAMKGDLRGLRYARDRHSYKPVSLWQAISFAPRHILNKF